MYYSADQSELLSFYSIRINFTFKDANKKYPVIPEHVSKYGPIKMLSYMYPSDNFTLIFIWIMLEFKMAIENSSFIYFSYMSCFWRSQQSSFIFQFPIITLLITSGILVRKYFASTTFGTCFISVACISYLSFKTFSAINIHYKVFQTLDKKNKIRREWTSLWRSMLHVYHKKVNISFQIYFLCILVS